jgi:hypothetical protein
MQEQQIFNETLNMRTREAIAPIHIGSSDIPRKSPENAFNIPSAIDPVENLTFCTYSFSV